MATQSPRYHVDSGHQQSSPSSYQHPSSMYIPSSPAYNPTTPGYEGRGPAYNGSPIKEEEEEDAKKNQ